MNENQKVIVDYLSVNPFMDGVTELDGDYESIPDEIYDAYYKLNYEEKLQAFKVAIENQLSSSLRF